MSPFWKALLQPGQLWTLFKETFTAWSNDNVPRHGAALAYYTVLSLVPLLVVIIAMTGLIFGREAAEGYILEQIGSLVGPQSMEAIKDMIQRASKPSTGLLATAAATGTLLLGASGVFAQLQDSLNSIWGVKPKEGRGLWGLVRDRFLSLATLVGTGFLLLVSLVLSAGLAAFGKWFGEWLPAPELVLQILELLVSLTVITGLFALIFKVLPDARVGWRDVWVGAALTALLFTIGKFAIGLYLGKSDIGSAYGAASSLVILLIWVYYSTQILLFGAEFTQVYANRLGSHIIPSDDAVVTNTGKAKEPDAQIPRPRAGRDSSINNDADLRAPIGNTLSTAYRSLPVEQPPGWFGVMVIGVTLIRLWRRSMK